MDNLTPPPRFKFSDDIMFSLVMEDKNICREVITRIIGSEIGEIKNIITQRTLVNKPKYKFTRLDVCVETTNGILYDVEIQIANRPFLERRIRYYQSMLDATTARTSSQYEELPDTYIIFICDFDYFKQGMPLYFFKNVCKDNEGLMLNDGTHKIIVNMLEYKKCENKPLKSLLQYIKTNNIADELTRRIDQMVNSNTYQQNALEGFFQFSTIDQDRRKDAFKEGEAKGRTLGLIKGRAEGKAEGAYQSKCETAKAFKEMGLSIAQIAKGTGLTQEEILKL